MRGFKPLAFSRARRATGLRARRAMVSVNDFSNRPASDLSRDDVLATGRYRFRFLPTPHVPHGWDAGVLFEENERTLFCSDLFHQWGHREPARRKDILERCKDALR